MHVYIYIYIFVHMRMRNSLVKLMQQNTKKQTNIQTNKQKCMVNKNCIAQNIKSTIQSRDNSWQIQMLFIFGIPCL